MSSLVLLQKMRVTSMLSLDKTMAWAIESMGVIPEPPAQRKIFDLGFKISFLS